MEDNILVVTKEQAIEILEDTKNKYFNGKAVNNTLYSVAIVVLLVLGLAFIILAVALILFSPFILLEFLIKKIFTKKEVLNENNNTTN